MYLFDASALVNLIRKGRVRPLARGATIELALYESLNAVWKEYKLLGRIDEETALELVDVISSVFNVIEVLSVKGLEKGIFELAARDGLTVYDASYLYVAMKNGYILVTDDRELRNRASRYVETVSSSELANKY
ncbi:type II toxin-antitoxin system VapC family toxin [Pyrodictium delaneyi]|uniref:DNA-binding protein n=1 Tax=Pyrodictium delaneyi TaxID=1273541 RepID=A0A211YP72_9CREN|nr:type II toxin-antitoxin system VapC family toxin [Pyrodictium delaneyi]OWJ54852.1 DNA-binding protein [Pyrodictium delaneyi]